MHFCIKAAALSSTGFAGSEIMLTWVSPQWHLALLDVSAPQRFDKL